MIASIPKELAIIALETLYMSTQPFSKDKLPQFKDIQPKLIESNLRNLLAKHRTKLKTLLFSDGPYHWDNLMQPLEDMSDELSQFWSPIGHLHSVAETEALRDAYHHSLPLITDYHTEMSQNEKLFNAISSIANSPEFAKLEPAQRKIIENDIRDFKLAGIHLPADKKARLATLQQELSLLTTKFSENLLDATNAWTHHVTDEKELDGLLPQALQLARDNAKQRKLEGYVLTLDYPSYSTAIKYLKHRELRKTIYEAYSTRASDCGPKAGKYDNTQIMEAILKTRHEIAQLVGFPDYADYSLATKMAKKPEEVLHFLKDLLHRSKPVAQKEFQALAKLAAEDGITQLEAWDISYYSEKLQQATFQFSDEDLRPYFPINKALEGLFATVHKLYGLTVKEEKNIDTWHPHVQFFSLYDSNNELRGGFYIDLYARQHKRDGAWMDECRMRRRLSDNTLQYPVAFLTCNFMPPSGNKEALLTHDDVITLFHEFGHCLHHMLTKVDFCSVGGINGVAWDAVEFPSQFLENYCWEKESLHLFASHYQTGAPVPDDLYNKMMSAKHFQTGLHMLRQIEFALFDFRLHLEYNPALALQVQKCLDDVRKETALYPVPSFNRFQHSFAHIFAGSYAAGYYSYKWAEVLSADAYAKFKENGVFDRKTGQSFMENILEVGGVRDPMASFIAFRGREPKIDALLEQSGITG
jgi:oligopeptidase A